MEVRIRQARRQWRAVLSSACAFAAVLACTACESGDSRPTSGAAALSSSSAAPAASLAVVPSAAPPPSPAATPAPVTTGATDPAGSGSPLVDTIERAARYLQTEPLRGDQALLINLGGAVLSESFARWARDLAPLQSVAEDAKLEPKKDTGLTGVEGMLWRERASTHRPWPPLPKPAGLAPLASSVKLSDDDLGIFMEMMRAVVTCRAARGGGVQAIERRFSPPSRGYILTHQLFGTTWARDHRCIADASADRLRAEVAPPVYRELLADGETINDLSIERMAMLCYAGLCEWLSDAHVENVIKTQATDGSWGDRGVDVHPAAFVPRAHTAALAFYFLAARWAGASSPLPAPRVPSRQ